MKSDRLRDILAIICSYIIIIGVILIVIKFIVPQMASSVSDLGTMIPSWYTRLLEIVNDMEQKFPELDFTQFNKEIEDMGGTVFSYNNIKEVLGSVIPVVFTTSVSLVKGLISFLITIIVSCYVLFDRQLIAKNAKRFINAIFSNDVSNYLIATTKECSDIFSRYVTGKLLDSLIIGILCFIIMNILKLPYAVIISVIVGITNMIPYFGPFIGAVPGAFIILMISPVKMVIYLIMILVLQQFDGLVLGPKILGDSTGLRPVWIIFAVSTGGAVAGVIGMFLGVPVIAVIAYLTEKWIDHRLQKKERRAQSVEQNEQVHESSPTSLS